MEGPTIYLFDPRAIDQTPVSPLSDSEMSTNSIEPWRTLFGDILVKVLAIYDDQAYYWTPAWQRDEQESREALSRGDYRDFDNVEDAIAWLTNGSG